MSSEQFWQIISSIDVTALEQGNEDQAVLPLQRKLEMLSESELASYAEHLSQNLYLLDGEQFAQYAGESGNSDDGFLYVRCWVVANGKSYFDEVINEPVRMSSAADQWCESLLYAHRFAWSKLTGKDDSDWPFEASVSYESGSNEVLWTR